MKRPRQSAVRHKAGPLALLNFVVNKTASFFLYSFRQFSTWKRNWIKDDKRSNPLKIKAFSVCRYYTVTAQLCLTAFGERCASEANPGVAGSQRYWHDGEYLQPFGLQVQDHLGKCDGQYPDPAGHKANRLAHLSSCRKSCTPMWPWEKRKAQSYGQKPWYDWVFGGELGIRTLGSFWEHDISSVAPSTSRTTLRIPQV